MPHGTPDWGHVGPKTTTYGLDDLGEHAVRLGTPVVWDRRGDQVFATDFRHGVGDVELFSSGALAATVLHTGAARQGAYCLKLTAGSSVFRYAAVRKSLPYLVAGRIGVEISFSFEADTDYIFLYGYVHDGAGVWEPELRLYPNTGVLQVRTAPLGAYVPVSTTAIVRLYASCLNTIKMVFDITRVFGVYTGYYVRAIVNEVEYPLDTHPISYIGGVAAPNAEFEFRHYGTAGNNPVAYADCLIVTQNEP